MDFFHLYVAPSGIGLQYCQIQYSSICTFDKTYRLIYPTKTHILMTGEKIYSLWILTWAVFANPSGEQMTYHHLPSSFPMWLLWEQTKPTSSLILWLGLSLITDTYCQGTCTKLPPQSSFGAEWRDQWMMCNTPWALHLLQNLFGRSVTRERLIFIHRSCFTK